MQLAYGALILYTLIAYCQLAFLSANNRLRFKTWLEEGETNEDTGTFHR
jgi:hypothetical protein